MTTKVLLAQTVVVPELGYCLEWTGALHKSGYGKRMYKQRSWLAHRAAWDEQVGEIPEGAFVLHRCDNRLCVRVEHLYIGNASDDMRDMVERGRQRYDGENNNRAVLSDEQVAEIRSRYTGTKRGNPLFVSQQELAEEYGVCQAHISKIVRGVNR